MHTERGHNPRCLTSFYCYISFLLCFFERIKSTDIGGQDEGGRSGTTFSLH